MRHATTINGSLAIIEGTYIAADGSQQNVRNFDRPSWSKADKTALDPAVYEVVEDISGVAAGPYTELEPETLEVVGDVVVASRVRRAMTTQEESNARDARMDTITDRDVGKALYTLATGIVIAARAQNPSLQPSDVLDFIETVMDDDEHASHIPVAGFRTWLRGRL